MGKSIDQELRDNNDDERFKRLKMALNAIAKSGAGGWLKWTRTRDTSMGQADQQPPNGEK